MTETTMRTTDLSFFSDGIRLNAKLFQPKIFSSERRIPLIICSGYTGLVSSYPTLLAHYLCSQNYSVLGFDYRGQGGSEGIRDRIIFEEQVNDVRNAVHFLKSNQEVDTSQGIGLVGWGMGAALAIYAAYRNSNISRIACINGFYDGERFYQYALSDQERSRLEQESQNASLSSSLQGTDTYVDPFKVYPVDSATMQIVKDKLWEDENFTQKVSIEFFESIRRMNALQLASSLEAPIFIAHGSKNPLHPLFESDRLKARVAPPSTFYQIEGTHNDFMDYQHPELERLCQGLGDWFSEVGSTQVEFSKTGFAKTAPGMEHPNPSQRPQVQAI
jgi:pimeloyl-ACP methyl ester carboxylesterase